MSIKMSRQYYKATSWNQVQGAMIEILENRELSKFSESREKILDMFFSKRDLDNSDLFDQCKNLS